MNWSSLWPMPLKHLWNAPAINSPLILGSKSSTRKTILEEMGWTQESLIVRTADMDESAIGDRSGGPEELVLLLGKEKASAILKNLNIDDSSRDDMLQGASWLLTGDQVVFHDGRILEKPQDADEVRRNMISFSKSPVSTVGSAVLTHIWDGWQVSGVFRATVVFRPFDEATIDAMCKEEEVMWCCGGLVVEHNLVQPFISTIEGTMDSILGLSKEVVLRLFKQAGREAKRRREMGNDDDKTNNNNYNAVNPGCAEETKSCST